MARVVAVVVGRAIVWGLVVKDVVREAVAGKVMVGGGAITVAMDRRGPAAGGGQAVAAAVAIAVPEAALAAAGSSVAEAVSSTVSVAVVAAVSECAVASAVATAVPVAA